MARSTNSSASTTIDVQSTQPVAVLRREGAARYIGISPITLDRLGRNGIGPPKCRLSATSFGFRIVDLDEWLAKRVDRATAEAAN